ncbi:glycosyltransferase family 15 protein [Terfezia boudieri ATCC MYA-4762]|uniref:Glycosyltransferase family 15 protein n=1 Tax=Terfezia boudieri ATCC MYA-4762 TaxID=1051890 RepID=A0A3N4LVN0_9PEZI|nr:glycosyltransferase family 15 protein [Terfezia boudieri ATCC MYA-4762]
MRLLHGKISTRILYLFTFVSISSLLSLAFLTRPRSKYDGPPPPFQRPTGTNSLKGIDPLLYNSGPPSGRLWYPQERALANATLLALVRNSEADAMVQSMLDLERIFNLKFNYPWTFLNNVPFDEEFKRKTRAATKAEISYELIPPEHWAVPSHIDPQVLNASMHRLEDLGVQYSTALSYHQMCRYNSGMFPFHPALLKYKYYWRVEPNVHFYCDLPYDPFHFLADRDLIYGFVIALYDAPASVASLWPEVLRFLASYTPGKAPLINPNAAVGFLTDSHYRPLHTLNASGYSTCHFWSNFEIGDMDFFRSPLYQAYFRHLDQSGGFFYERWGDAPVHSIALSLFADKKGIHWFRDIAYEHIPYFNCPRVDSSGAEGRCQAGRFTNGDKTLEEEDCRANWFHYAGIG